MANKFIKLIAMFNTWRRMRKMGYTCRISILKNNISSREILQEIKKNLEGIEVAQIKNQVDHPQHYGGKDNPFEPIKIIDAMELNFYRGNALKYLLRAGRKNNEIEDLEKAVWYIKHEINKLKRNG